MNLEGKTLKTLAVLPTMLTVPDCWVKLKNKIGGGHGEKKFYISSKHDMYDFFGNPGFVAKCFLLKKDLISYMQAIKSEYMHPSQNYAGMSELPSLWEERLNKINLLDDVILFDIEDQKQIQGDRGYVSSNDLGFDLLREISLPLVSYIYIEKMGTEDNALYYWKLFVDFETVNELAGGPLVLKYGLGKSNKEIANEGSIDDSTTRSGITTGTYRIGQERYREQLLEQCRFCPFTGISDERLLIASHIKPWAVSNDEEKVDPYNGYILSPLYDKLFDAGFITFTEKKHVILSDFISPYTWKRIDIQNNQYIQSLPMDEKRINYLRFHHESVFKGYYDESL